MTVPTILPHAAPSSDLTLDPTAADIASLARELCAAEGLGWPDALAHAACRLARCPSRCRTHPYVVGTITATVAE